MNCEPNNERYMPHNIEPPPASARSHCVINGTDKCCGRPWWEDEDWQDSGLPPERDEGWE